MADEMKCWMAAIVRSGFAAWDERSMREMALQDGKAESGSQLCILVVSQVR